MKPVQQVSFACLVVAVAFGAAAGSATAGDQAIVRGMIETIDPAGETVEVLTVGGERLKLLVGPTSRLTNDDRPATIHDLRRGRRVRVVYEKAGTANRIVNL